MSGLTEFLLARIAEDEASAAAFRANWIAAGCTAGELDTDFGVYPSTEYTEIGLGLGRFLAECEAKRSLIDMHPEAVSEPLRPGARWAYAEILRRLALSYADHPDYREEWRP